MATITQQQGSPGRLVTPEGNCLEALPADYHSPSRSDAVVPAQEAMAVTPPRRLKDISEAETRFASEKLNSSSEEINVTPESSSHSSEEIDVTPDKALDLLTRMLLGEGTETVLAELDILSERTWQSGNERTI
eukprot:TRINITY_DN7970_c0_g1_i1.p1 TRINITY_DN7970_c0_g1~~TRINITY_DN7970_c0_g1_i1.p1  ORF type:complete len:133 (-),score=23.16 TRINITY_DN7970_c0_g1_i1:93-491(-)